MNLIMKCARVLVLLMAGLWLAVPGLADNGDGANFCDPIPCTLEGPRDFGVIRDHSRPGSVIVFPLFISNGGDAEECGAGNILVNRVCLPRTEIELGATCPTRFTVASDFFPPPPSNQPPTPCPVHEAVRVRFHWVCPGIQDLEHKSICRTSDFDVHLTVNRKVVFTANGFMLPDSNQVHVPAAPCERGYLIGWVVDPDSGQPIKYDGLIGEAVIRSSGTAAAAYRGITIQAFAETQTRSVIDRVSDPLGSQRLGLPFFGIPRKDFSSNRTK